MLDSDAVMDNETSLIWERSPDHSQTRNWQDAIQYCYSKTIGDRNGWRLPTVEELLSLIDACQSKPALPLNNALINITTYYCITSASFILSNEFHANFGSNNWNK